MNNTLREKGILVYVYCDFDCGLDASYFPHSRLCGYFTLIHRLIIFLRYYADKQTDTVVSTTTIV